MSPLPTSNIYWISQTMTKRFSQPRSVSVGLTVVLLFLTGCSSTPGSDDQGEVKKSQPGDLYVQIARMASLSNGTLRLTGADRTTLFFTDQPERQTGYVSTAGFVNRWREATPSPAPNATLAIMKEPEPEEIVLVLKGLRQEGDDLIYDVDVLRGPNTASSEAALFIDPLVVTFRPPPLRIAPPPPPGPPPPAARRGPAPPPPHHAPPPHP